jgi:hypothetical protein
MKKQSVKKTAGKTDFESLVVTIVQIHQQAQEFSTKAVNVGLTLRNWMIGRQIEVYERQGIDRAAYGDRLMDVLARHLATQGWERCDRRELYRFRKFYVTYPNIVETLTPQSVWLPHLRHSSSSLSAICPTSSSSPATPWKCRRSRKWKPSSNNSERKSAMKANPIRQPALAPVDPDFAEIRALAATLHDLHRQQVAALTPIVRNLIRSQSRSAQELEHTLDHLLDCACIPEGLALFKALCRYYYAINPAATASYVHAYREMWDSDEPEKEGEP